MKRIKVYNQVTSGTPFLSVPSRFPPLPILQKIIVFGAFYALALLFAGNSILMPKMPWLLRILGVLIGPIFVFLGHFLVAQGDARKKGMIVTDIGISIGPWQCALWSEITSWKFATFSGLKRVTISHAGEGVSLRLTMDDLKISQGCFAGSRGGTAFAEQGYYFDESQQTILRELFAKQNIPEW
ncbi:MAG: hypothetical protein H7Y27_00775 [Gemmatimonadaceae bacterium]|nr:hypothetical protein [Chitinophagaceae bacterium]